MKPAQISKALRRLSSYINTNSSPSLDIVTHKLRKILALTDQPIVKAPEGSTEGPQEDGTYVYEGYVYGDLEDAVDNYGEIKLQGPFHRSSTGYHEYHVEIEGIITNPEFLELDPEAAEHVWHTLLVDITWYHTPADPSVGIPSAYSELDDFEVLGILDHESNNLGTYFEKADADRMKAEFADRIKDRESNLLDQLEEMSSEY